MLLFQCEADLPSYLKLGRVEVTCEGFDHPDDPYILRGSCGLEYTMEQVGPSPQAYGSCFCVGEIFFIVVRVH